MNRQHAAHLLAVLAVALAVRILFFDLVGVWGDFGFYTYDSRLILEGQTPFVDFLGRSPLFLYTFALARDLVGHPVPLLRAFITAWWFLTALPVYLITRRVHTHRAGLAAVALFLLAPFAVAYHSWANTQSMAAFFGATAVLLLVRKHSARNLALAGILIGLAFLARRSFIVLLPAIGLWLLADYYQHNTPPQRTLAQSAGKTTLVACTFTLTLAVGYTAVVGPARWTDLYTTHFLNLFLSVGRGGYPILGVDAPPVTNQLTRGRIPIFNELCQLCGVWTARTFAKTLLVASPVVGGLTVYLRDWSTHWFTDAHRDYLAGILITLGLYATVRVLLAGYYNRIGVILAFALFAVVIYRTRALPRRHLYDRRLQLVLIVLLGFAAGYLYRNRFLHTYYFADLMPYLCILAGIAYTDLYEYASTRGRQLLALALTLAVITSFVGAHPIAVIVLENNDDGWFTMNNIEEYGSDLEQRVDDDRVVWTGHPTYVAGTDVRLAGDVSRGHYLGATFEDEGPAADYYQTVIQGLRSGHIQYVIVGKMTHRLLIWNETARRLFEEHYCHVDSAQSLYNRTDASLYEYNRDCTAHPTVTANFTNPLPTTPDS